MRLNVSKKFPKLSLILGGANSGKSAFAEQLVCSSALTKNYIATAQAFDDEMRAKISDHRSQRGPDWLTIEAPLDVKSALATCTIGQIVLLDCATLWLSNILLADQDIAAACASLLAALTTCPAHVIT